MDLEKKFLSGFLDDLNANRVVLPSLPEVAMQVRKIVEDPAVTAAQVERVINTDPALIARMLKVVNSPAYRGTQPIDNLRVAITRLGTEIIRNLVTSQVMQQLYQSQNVSSGVTQHLKALWQHSTQVATLSHVLAKHFTTLRPDHAMLAGLVHDIGMLPVLMRSELHPELLEDTTTLERVMRRLHTLIGTTVLQEWQFPREIVAVAAEHEDITAARAGPVDYVDVVIVANLHSYIGTPHRHGKLDWGTVPAFAKLGMTPEESMQAMEEAKGELREVHALLGT